MKDKNIIKFFKLFIKPVLKQQIVAFICLMIFTVSNITFPYFLKLIIDEALERRNLKLLIIYGISMVLTAAISVIFNYFQSMKFIKIGQKVTFNMKQKMLKKLMCYSYNFYSKHSVGEITSIIEEDTNSIEALSTNVISDFLVSLFTALGLFIILFTMDIHIALSAIILTLLFAVIQNKIGKIIKMKTSDFRQKIAQMYAQTYETISGISFIQILKCQNIFKKSYEQKQKQCIKSNISFSSTRINSSSVAIAFNSLAVILVLIIGGYKVLNYKLTVGALFTLTIYIQRVFSPVVKLANTYITIEKSKAILNRIFNLMEDKNIIKDGFIEHKHCLKGNIDFQDVNFKYGNKTILNSVNFSIKSGEIIGLVGENGSGKTSITRILTRLCSPISGNILIDEENIEDFKLDYLRSQIGYMTQKVFMFKGTIRDNLLLSNKDISKDKINKILEIVRIKKDIDKMPKGLDTLIGENGNNLSGGQAQKIALARILLKDPPIIILDEPTSALDIEAEKFLVKSLNYLLNNKTIIIISHREEILKNCSRILKLNNSKIYELETMSA